MKSVPYITSPKLQDAVVQKIRQRFDSNLSWLEYSFPIVQTGIMESDGEEFTYPQVYAGDKSTKYYDVRPDWKVKSYCFFEFGGATENAEGAIYNLSVTFYARLDLCGYVEPTSLLSDVLEQLRHPSIDAGELQWTTDVDDVFDGYTDLRRIMTQALMRHGTAFKVNFTTYEIC